MAVDERRLSVDELRLGMFVTRLDREWLGTPFPIQGFFIEGQDDIERVGRYCRHVYIDVLAVPDYSRRRLLTLEGQRIGGVPLRRVLPYSTRTVVRDEAPKARQVQAKVLALAAEIELDLKAGRPLSEDRVEATIEPLVASVLRNPDAVFWLLGLMRRDRYTHGHALQCSALAAAFGRHLAMPRDMLLDLAMGGFLFDVGMTEVPAAVLDKPGPLDDDEQAVMREHVATGLRILETADIARLTVQEMLAGHHERHDGSGYPQGLVGESIPLAARIAAIIDSYDAMIHPGPHRMGQAPHVVLQHLYRARGTDYQEEVVEQFLQCLGVYPTGSLVELSNGEVAVVMAQNHARRLRPRVMIVLDADKRPYPRFHDIDLMAVDEDAAGRPVVVIASALAPGAYGLEAAELFLG